MKTLEQWEKDYMEKYPENYVFGVAFNDLNDYTSKEKVWKSLNAQCTPKQFDEYFSQLGYEFDLISTLEKFHDNDIINHFGDAIYNDRDLYDVPMWKLNNDAFLAKHIKNNYMDNE